MNFPVLVLAEPTEHLYVAMCPESERSAKRWLNWIAGHVYSSSTETAAAGVLRSNGLAFLF